MQVTSGLKNRSPFAFASDEDNLVEDTAFLDDQEQEEVLKFLKAENDTSDRQMWLCLRIVMGCFASLHALYIFRGANPFGQFLSNSNAQPPRIPFDIPFALLHTVILLGFAVLSQRDDPTPGVRILMPNYARVYAITAIAPTYCILTHQGLANISWWSFALMGVSLHQFFRSLIHQGRNNISQLEALKYDARGA